MSEWPKESYTKGYEDGWKRMEYYRQQDEMRIAELETQLAKLQAHRCEHCGAAISNYPTGCPTCGAPVCCPMCCKIEFLKDRIGVHERARSKSKDRAEKAEAERDALRYALTRVQSQGHNDDCIFCGFKDKIALDALAQGGEGVSNE